MGNPADNVERNMYRRARALTVEQLAAEIASTTDVRWREVCEAELAARAQ